MKLTWKAFRCIPNEPHLVPQTKLTVSNLLILFDEFEFALILSVKLGWWAFERDSSKFWQRKYKIKHPAQSSKCTSGWWSKIVIDDFGWPHLEGQIWRQGFVSTNLELRNIIKAHVDCYKFGGIVHCTMYRVVWQRKKNRQVVQICINANFGGPVLILGVFTLILGV